MLCLMLFHYHSGMNSRVELNRAMCIIIVVITLNAHWNLSDTKKAQFGSSVFEFLGD